MIAINTTTAPKAITVVKKVSNKDMFGDNPPVGCTASPECNRLELGHEFVSEEGRFPPGF